MLSLPLCGRVAESAATTAPTSWRARGLSLALRTTVRPIIGVWSLAPWFPWPYAAIDLAGLLPRVVAGTRFERTHLAGIPVQRITPANVTTGRTILYFHGGAFIVGGWHLHRGLLSHIAAATGAVVMSVDYRQFPHAPNSVSVTDCAGAYRALLEHVPADEIIIMGDSAGGFLTFSTMAYASLNDLPMPLAAVTYSPLPGWRDADDHRGYSGCAVFGPRAIPTMARYATKREIDPDHLTPWDVIGAALPPILVQAAAGESLYSDIADLVAELELAGAPVELRAWDLDVHVFQASVGWVPESRDAVRHAAEFCERAWVGSRTRKRVG